MDTLTSPVQALITVKGSRFLSELLPCPLQAEARSILKAQKVKYSDATHVVHAFIIGAAGEIRGLSDDGEPSGTAGRPVMDVLAGRHCTNTMLTVTRWFGGTLLGTGGLVRAYSDAAKAVIAQAEEKKAFTLLIETVPFSLAFDYAAYNAALSVMPRFHIHDEVKEFAASVVITGKAEANEADKFFSAIRDATGGKCIITRL